MREKSAALEPVAGDAVELRRVFGCFPSAIAAVCALADHGPAGMAASSFTTVSKDPPLVSVCVQNTSATWPALRGRPRLGVSALAQDHEDVGEQLATKDGDRFAGVAWEATPDGGVPLGGSTTWLDCSLHAEVPASDHVVALLEIHRMAADPDTAPPVFRRAPSGDSTSLPETARRFSALSGYACSSKTSSQPQKKDHQPKL